MQNSTILQFASGAGESGRKVADKSEASSPKSGLKAWRDRVKRSTEAFRGDAGDGREYVVRLQVAGKRRYIELGTTDLDAAAKRARSFFFDVQSLGWDAAILKLHPARPIPTVPADKLTIGEYLQAVKEVWHARELTYWEACAKLRRLVALTLGMEPGAGERWRGPKAGETPWQKRINAIRVSDLTPAAITKAMNDYVRLREGGAEAQLAAKHTINSLVTNSRSLFSRRNVVPRLTVALPVVLPFDGVKNLKERMGEFRFRRDVDVHQLIQQAREELAPNNPVLFVMFLLALGAGLRRHEIDKLRWRELVQIAEQVEVIKSDCFDAKSYRSLRKVKLPRQFYQILLEFRDNAPLDAFVFSSERPGVLNERRRMYRCDADFRKLNAWLEGKGVKPRDGKKIQALRKHFGDVICATYGIYKAAAALGHQKVSTTERFYAAPPEVEAAPFELMDIPKSQ